MHLPDLFPDSMNLGRVARKVSNALNQAKYTDQGWFVVSPAGSTSADSSTPPNVLGFAVVTKLEQIDPNGVSKPLSSVGTPSLSHTSSFLDSVKLLLKGAPNGRYRLFLIWVSNNPVSQLRLLLLRTSGRITFATVQRVRG